MVIITRIRNYVRKSHGLIHSQVMYLGQRNKVIHFINTVRYSNRHCF
jgi:hypothetical protein